MKKLFTILSLACIPLLGTAQYEAQAVMDFDDGQIPELEGFHNVDGTGDVLIKKGVNEGTYTQSANEIVTDENQTVLFTDYEGYIGFDENLLNKNSYSFVADYKWTGQDVWWLGFLNFVGYDESQMIEDPDNPENEINEPAWVAPKIQIKQPSGLLDGIGLTTEDEVFQKDTYYHIVFTYDEGIAKIYIDGELKGETPAEEPLDFHTYSEFKLFVGAKVEVDSETGDISMGADGGGNSKSTQAYMDNVALFNRVLNADEAVQLSQGAPVVTNISEVEKTDNTGSFYPNPAKEQLTINSDNVVKVNIYNLSGSKVLSLENVNNTINVSSLSNGIYMVQCFDSKGKVTVNQKLIIIK